MGLNSEIIVKLYNLWIMLQDCTIPFIIKFRSHQKLLSKKMIPPSSPKSTTTEKYSPEGVAFRFMNAVLDFMAKNAQQPSEIYQLLSQSGSVLLLQGEEFPKHLSQYIESKFEEADKEHTGPNNFQAKYQISVQLFNFCTFLQNVRLPAILPFQSPILSPEDQRKIDYKYKDAPSIKQYDFNHYQEISIAGLETLLQSNRSPIQMPDFKESTNSNKTKIPPNIASDIRFLLMGPKIELQLASLYLQRSYNPFQVMKDMKNDHSQQFPPLYTHNHHEKFFRSSNEDIALYYLKSALNVITVQNSPDDFAVAHSQMAHLLKQKKRYDEAIKGFQKVLEVRKPTDPDPTKYASLCMNIANTYLAKVEEAWTHEKTLQEKHDDVVLKLVREYSIVLRDRLMTTQQPVNEQTKTAATNWIQWIETAIEWFDKSENAFKKLKRPPQSEKKEISTNDQYIGLISLNLGYAHLLKTRLLMQIFLSPTMGSDNNEIVKKVRSSANQAVSILKRALEVIKPDVNDKDSIMKNVRSMGAENFPKLNVYLAESYLYLLTLDELEHITDAQTNYLEEARACLDLGATLFMKKEMKDWRIKLNFLLFEVYYLSSSLIVPVDKASEEKKQQYMERSEQCLRESSKERIQDDIDTDFLTYDVDGFLEKHLMKLSLQ